MKILFLHGWHSSPGGMKPVYLSRAGFEVVNPSLCSEDFDFALSVAQDAYESSRPDLVVGSSRGGAIAMNLKQRSAPAILVCPAWKNWGKADTVGRRDIILHSPQDEVIPFQDSQELIRRSGLAPTALVAVGEEHRMADAAALERLIQECQKLA